MTRFVHAILAMAFAMPTIADDPYRWPLDLPRQLTSSFAEYRSGRFHAGLDLRTGAIGKPVYAAGDGYVERIRSSPYGYGNAIYLRLNDGPSIVYGHLDSFEEPMADYVRQAQHTRESISVDLYPDKRLFPIRRGQLIAHSGNSGIGYPHLHYEFRDDAERPINPRLLGVTWPDNVRPIARKVTVVPQGPGSSVNGDLEPVVLEVRETAPGAYTTEPVHAWGAVGVGVDVVDPADGNELGVWRIETSVDDTETFCIQHDVISYDNTHNASVAYHPFFADRGRFLVQWRWPGNECAIYDHSTATGWIDVLDGEHAIALRILDFNENEALITIPLIGEQPATITPAAANTQQGLVEIQCWGDWLVVSATFPASDAETPVLLVNGAVEADAFRAVSDTTWRAAFRAVPGTEHLVIETQHPRLAPFRKEFIVAIRGENARVFRAADLEIHTAPASPYGMLYLTVDRASVAGRTPEPPLGQAYAIGFPQNPIDEPIQVTFRVPLEGVQPDRVDIYRVSGNHASPLEAEREGDRLTVTTRSLGTFVALEDKTPPAIRDFKSTSGPANARPAIEATVVDNLSGIDDIRLTLNDHWLLIRYDPEHNRIRWEQDHDLPGGVGDLTLAVRDNAGNIQESTIAVSIP